jgi:hypothetical protein
MKSIKYICFFTLCIFTVISSSNAQLIPVLGSQRAGTAMFQFLKIGVGGRAVGMGEAFVAVANDASALYWNPAGIVKSSRIQDESTVGISANKGSGNNSFLFSHINWPVDVRHDFVGYVRQLGVNAIGLSFTALHTDDFEETTEYQPLGTGNYVSFGDIAVGLTFARKMTDRFVLGATVKYIDETLAELHARSVLIDFGTLYWTGFGSSRFAVSVTNFGTNAGPSGSLFLRDDTEVNKFQDFSPPTIFRIGFATEVIENENNKFTTAVQLNHPNDNSENVNFGAEYWWNNLLALRGGYRLNMDEESFTFGGGLKLPVNYFEMDLDFSYTNFGRLGNAIRFSANLVF